MCLNFSQNSLLEIKEATSNHQNPQISEKVDMEVYLKVSCVTLRWL